ncbi:beta-lactamase family protein [Pseudomonadales bacterium]|nr:beta-lactamase family protein [Pseudomonadales bacterium]MDB9942763.1 beta-lactamase family protein [Pseudomonadales bacterium]
MGLSSERLSRITAWLEQQVGTNRLAGCSALVARHGEVVYQQSVGHADLETAKPFANDTIVRAYSMTKPITTMAAMMLYEESCFQLDDPVALYLPEFLQTRVWAGGNASLEETTPQETPMTVRHLMTHTSGLTYGFMQANVVDAAYRQAGVEQPSDVKDLEEWVQRAAALPLICQPGSQWNYSISTDVLGRLVEVWSGLSLEDFFQQRIFNPLQMLDTGFHVTAENQARFAALYSPLSGADMSHVAKSGDALAVVKPPGIKLQEGSAKSSYFEPASLFSGGGGLVSSMADYARFCQMLLNKGELDGKRLLGRKTVEYMRTNQLPNNGDMADMGQPVWSETSYDGIGFGLGFAVVLDPVKAHIITSVGEHHWGGAASTFFWIDPVEDLYVIFLTQLIPSSTYPIRRELRSRVYQALIGD